MKDINPNVVSVCIVLLVAVIIGLSVFNIFKTPRVPPTPSITRVHVLEKNN